MKRDLQSVVKAVEDVEEDVERSMKEKKKQLKRELELKEEEKQQMERKNAELEKTIRGETSPNQTGTENHQNQQQITRRTGLDRECGLFRGKWEIKTVNKGRSDRRCRFPLAESSSDVTAAENLFMCLMSKVQREY
ncbi:hypothetical protein WMY93_014972 [Mugilogobius chulae]|uniref:Uncharacterized protein n=1 Tax=Mugilogobius chulae TaxID=88201 RepID=A0AAW0P5W9_9GOBI